MGTITPQFMGLMRQEIAHAPRGHRGTVVDRYAELLNCSRAKIYRQLSSGLPKERARKGNPELSEIEVWTRHVWQVKTKPPEEAGELSTDQAIEIAVHDPACPVPPEALGVSVSTFNRTARRLGLTKAGKRASRFQARRPNQVHHIDASNSAHLYVARKVGTDYVLKVWRPAKHYKNKPVGPERERVWIYGAVDDYSGRFEGRYTIAPGENIHDGLLFLQYAWSRIGVPEQLWADQGSLKKGVASSDLMARMKITMPNFAPYKKDVHGKIERVWRTIWQRFEKPFFAGDWDRVELTLGELNERLQHYIAGDYNQRPHRLERGVNRMDMWRRIALYGGAVMPPENLLGTVASFDLRTVGKDGCIAFLGRTYEVKGLHEAKVRVLQGVYDDRLVVQDLETGIKYEVTEYEPLGIDEFRGHAKTPRERVIEEGLNLSLTHQLHTAPAPDNPKVTAMPIRTKEERRVADPFDTTVYQSIEDAWREFTSIVGALDLDRGHLVAIKEHIRDTLKLDRRATVDLAQELAARKNHLALAQ